MKNQGWYGRFGKRTLDVVGAGAGLLALGPVLLVIAAAIKVRRDGSVLFKQTRAGRGFKRFTIYKFRSMSLDCGGIQLTKAGDARVTPLGRVLRKTKLDELPQLLNVLIGDMSLVGPRPTVPKYAEMYRAGYEAILSVKPGITDFASIRYRDEESVLRPYEDTEAAYMDDLLPEKMALYRRYIDEVSLRTDLKILWATAVKLLGPASARGETVAADSVRILPVGARAGWASTLALDAAAVLAAYVGAFVLHFGLAHVSEYLRPLAQSAPIAAAAYAAASVCFGVNRGLRYYAGFGDVLDILKAVAAAAALFSLAAGLALGPCIPRTVILLWSLLALVAVAGLRASVHSLRHRFRVRSGGAARRCDVMILGVGDLAELAYQNMRAHETVDYRIAAFYDDSVPKCGFTLHGARLIGGQKALAAFLRRRPLAELVVAVEPARRAKVLRDVALALEGLERAPEVSVMPELSELLSPARRDRRRRVEPADLLNRTVSLPHPAASVRALEGKVVLITGAAGTVGGELARQAARCKPKKIILLDNHATALFHCEAELRQAADDLRVSATLGDVRDVGLLDKLFEEERPQLVFHAAAHKHIYQLETNVREALSNNLFGTYRVAAAADRAGAEAFILLSTDKAERPTSVMAASKRAAEILISALAQKSKTRFASVRFGNVFGTSGSVVKIFQEQIEKGRPLTVKHPEAARYFMTVEEAASLILQSVALADRGEVFALRLGEQIRILDIARSLVRFSGLDPDRDVEIRFVGPRPGEAEVDFAQEATGRSLPDFPGITMLPSQTKDLEPLAREILRIELLDFSSERDTIMAMLSSLLPACPGALGTEGVPPLPPPPSGA